MLSWVIKLHTPVCMFDLSQRRKKCGTFVFTTTSFWMLLLLLWTKLIDWFYFVYYKLLTRFNTNKNRTFILVVVGVAVQVLIISYLINFFHQVRKRFSYVSKEVD